MPRKTGAVDDDASADPRQDHAVYGRREEPAALSGRSVGVAGMANHDEGAAGHAFVRRHERRIFGIVRARHRQRPHGRRGRRAGGLRARLATRRDLRRPPGRPVVTWTSTITRNLAIDALRLRRAYPTDPDDVIWTGMVSDDGALDDRAVRGDEMARARAGP